MSHCKARKTTRLIVERDMHMQKREREMHVNDKCQIQESMYLYRERKGLQIGKGT